MKSFRLAMILLLALTLALPALPASAAGNTWIVNAALADDSNCTPAVRQCKTITAAITAASAGDTLFIYKGVYVENLVVPKALTLQGAGAGLVTLYPALSAPNPCSGASLCPGASYSILVEASDVTIAGMTIDGDNPALTSGVVRGGADLDARNGIITNHALGVVYNNLIVHDVVVKNIYLRAVYASTGGTFNFHHNTVQNVQGEANSIAMFNFYGAGIYAYNTVSDANDGIVSNWSSGTQYVYNTVTNAGTGLHSDNNGGVGGFPDVLAYNTVSNCTPGGYGLFVFAPFLPAVLHNNTVTNCDVGMAVSGRNGAITVPISVNNNHLTGNGVTGGAGLYITNDRWGWGYTDVSAIVHNNAIRGYETGVYLEEKGNGVGADRYRMDATLNNNAILGNVNDGLYYSGTQTIGAEWNYWGGPLGPGLGGNNPVTVQGTGVVNTTPFYGAWIGGTAASTHEVGASGSFAASVSAPGLYGLQLRLSHDPAVLAFDKPGSSATNAGGFFWDYLAEDFVAVTAPTGVRLSGSMSAASGHPTGVNLLDANLATFGYTCAAPGASPLQYDASGAFGTKLSDVNGFEIPAALTGDAIVCLPATASLQGTIALQGRLATNPLPAAWNDAYVTLTCASPECTGYGPYVFVTGQDGTYSLVKGGPGSGIAQGSYSVSATRRAYLPAYKASLVVITAGTTTISPTPTLLGGDVIGNSSVDVYDLTAVGGAFGTSTTADTGNDINGDAFVNIFDLVMVGSNFGQTATPWP